MDRHRTFITSQKDSLAANGFVKLIAIDPKLLTSIGFVGYQLRIDLFGIVRPLGIPMDTRAKLISALSSAA
jgi:hypothetical protein